MNGHLRSDQGAEPAGVLHQQHEGRHDDRGESEQNRCARCNAGESGHETAHGSVPRAQHVPLDVRTQFFAGHAPAEHARRTLDRRAVVSRDPHIALEVRGHVAPIAVAEDSSERCLTPKDLRSTDKGLFLGRGCFHDPKSNPITPQSATTSYRRP